jgi:hypothetical protein
MATTDGLIIATTSVILGSGGVLFSAGGRVQSGLMGTGVTVGVGDGLGDGETLISGSRSHPTPDRRNKTKIKQAIAYFTLVLNIACFILTYGCNLSKDRGRGVTPPPI